MQVISVYAPIQHQLSLVEEKIRSVSNTPSPILNELLGYALNISGKRIRPALALLASQISPNDSDDKPVTMATAAELLHAATLIHDDMVDDSDTRHGRATIGSIWGKDVAVLLGDYVFAASTTFVCDTGSLRVIRRFSETLRELSDGELHERLTSFDLSQTREDYWIRIYNKTASLFSTAAFSGAILGGSDEGDIAAIEGYGRNLGMAFQIVDDILDFQGTQEETGKPVGADLLHGTLTLPSILLLERYPKDNPIRGIFEDPDSEGSLKRVLDMIRNSTIIEESYEVARGFIDEARRCLDPVPESSSRQALLDLLDYVFQRRS